MYCKGYFHPFVTWRVGNQDLPRREGKDKCKAQLICPVGRPQKMLWGQWQWMKLDRNQIPFNLLLLYLISITNKAIPLTYVILIRHKKSVGVILETISNKHPPQLVLVWMLCTHSFSKPTVLRSVCFIFGMCPGISGSLKLKDFANIVKFLKGNITRVI